MWVVVLACRQLVERPTGRWVDGCLGLLSAGALWQGGWMVVLACQLAPYGKVGGWLSGLVVS